MVILLFFITKRDVFDGEPSIHSIRKNGKDRIDVSISANTMIIANHIFAIKYIALFM